jgi:argininosuccinate lyase
MSKLWGGRFARPTDTLVRQFHDSLPFDVRMYNEDITGSIAWAKGLVKAGILTAAEATTIIDGLEKVRTEFQEARFVFDEGDEDIHTAVERRLTAIVGPVGGKLHTGRSRNDQVATDFRLWTMQAIAHIQAQLAQLQEAIVNNAEENVMVPMPGYTHLQHAQPVTWGHWLLSHFWPLQRDQKRWAEVLQRTAVCPLGSAAFAGSAFSIDREFLAQELGFTTITPNSQDGVSDRDFVADFLYAATMTGLHLSRLSEQLALYCSTEFGFVRLDDAYATGSSIMPQKKNPDTLELTRGKAGRLLGNLTGFLATIKGLPSSYDKDLQEDKEPLFDAFDTLDLALPVMAGVISTLTINADKMAAQLDPGLLATDLADYLVRRGLPFRQAHHIIGEVVQTAENRGVDITALTLADLQGISDLFGDDVTAVFNFQASLNSRDVPGGTSEKALQQQLQKARKCFD